MATLQMTRDRTKLFQIAVTQDGAPLDISSRPLQFSAKESLYDGTVLIEKTTSAGITITDGPGGIALLQIDPDDTSTLSDIQSHTLVWDLKLADGALNYGIASGTLKVIGNVGA